jgi:hypothetical protein
MRKINGIFFHGKQLSFKDRAKNFSVSWPAGIGIISSR